MAIAQVGYRRVVVVFSPCADGYEKRKLGDLAVGASHRIAMLESAGCLVDLFECQRDEATVDLQTVRASFVERLPAGWEPFFLSGADTSRWEWVRPELALGINRLIIVNRTGSEKIVKECERSYSLGSWPGKLFVAHGEDSGKSSTSIRAAVAGTGDLEEATGVPAIARYIKENSLYALI